MEITPDDLAAILLGGADAIDTAAPCVACGAKAGQRCNWNNPDGGDTHPGRIEITSAATVIQVALRGMAAGAQMIADDEAEIPGGPLDDIVTTAGALLDARDNLVEAALAWEAKNVWPYPRPAAAAADLGRLLGAIRAYRDTLKSETTDTGPMPVFTLKAQDALAVAVIEEYRELCEDQGLATQAAEVDKALAEIHAWRARNPERVKLPDHVHVSARPEPRS